MDKAFKTLLKASADGLAIYKNRVEEMGADNVQKTFFTSLFAEQKDGSVTSQDNLLSEGQLYIIAGSDTTANTLTYLVWTLARMPELKDRLIEELNTLPDNYTDEDLRKLDLMNRVIKEALRVYPATPEGLPRLVPAGGVELCGYALDAETVVAAQPFSMHRNPEVFERADEFNPDRWINPTKEMTDSFMAFGRGSRGKYSHLVS